MESCVECNGTGVVDGETCESCFGYGDDIPRCHFCGSPDLNVSIDKDRDDIYIECRSCGVDY